MLFETSIWIFIFRLCFFTLHVTVPFCEKYVCFTDSAVNFLYQVLQDRFIHLNIEVIKYVFIIITSNFLYHKICERFCYNQCSKFCKLFALLWNWCMSLRFAVNWSTEKNQMYNNLICFTVTQQIPSNYGLWKKCLLCI